MLWILLGLGALRGLSALRRPDWTADPSDLDEFIRET